MEYVMSCKHCDVANEKIELRTNEFILTLMKELMEDGTAEHMPPPAVLLRSMASLGEILKQSIEHEVKRIGNQRVSLIVKAEEEETMVQWCVDAMFSIVDNTLPINMAVRKDGFATFLSTLKH